jgi:ADP-heptose:LPS heptosyltransferase
MRRILVIKLGALGDFVQATPAFAAIRAHERNAHITLLTTRGLLELAHPAPFFDAVAIDERRPWWDVKSLLRLHHKLRGFDRVYDLQTNDRTSVYYWLAGRPEWNGAPLGVAKGISHPQTHPDRDNLHTLDRLADQLRAAGMHVSGSPDITYAKDDAGPLLRSHDLKTFVALVPGGSRHRPEKRWPHFAELIARLSERKLTCVLIGGPDERALLDDLAQQTGAINLCGRTTLPELIDIFGRALAVIGNDTGPMHLAAAAGARGAVLFGSGSNPALCAPRAEKIHVLSANPLATLLPSDVLRTLGL